MSFIGARFMAKGITSPVSKRAPKPSSTRNGKAKNLKSLRIFISHKSKDKVAVMALKQMVEERCTKLSVFASCDAGNLRGGDRWSAVIHRELDRADWLVLLYTTPNEDWDWCIYEAGYFAGRRTSSRTKTLAVIHPAGVVIPPPLREWQGVKAEPESVLAFLKTVFKPGSARCHWTGTMADLEQTADSISEAVRPLGGNSHEPNKSMTVVVPHTEHPLATDDLPDQTYVALDRLTADLFGLVEDARYPWPKFRDAARRFGFDIPALVKAVHHARSQQAVAPALEQFRTPRDGHGYRPIIYSVDCEKSGKVSLKLVFWAQSKAHDPIISNSFERVRRLFNVATKFRRQVGEQHANAAVHIRGRPLDEKIKFLKRVVYDIEEVSNEAEADGLRDTDRLLEAFDGEQRAEVAEMLEHWPLAMQNLRDAIDAAKCDAPADLLKPLRLMNLRFLVLSAERLRQLILSFPIPGAAANNPNAVNNPQAPARMSESIPEAGRVV